MFERLGDSAVSTIGPPGRRCHPHALCEFNRRGYFHANDELARGTVNSILRQAGLK
jgi:hypothetical protein